MLEKQRLIGLVAAAVQKLGSNAAVARYVGKSPQLITEYLKGRTTPPGDVVVRLQDLVKRVACVLFVIVPLTISLDAGATGMRSIQQDSRPNYILHIVQQLAAYLYALLTAATIGSSCGPRRALDTMSAFRPGAA